MSPKVEAFVILGMAFLAGGLGGSILTTIVLWLKHPWRDL